MKSSKLKLEYSKEELEYIVDSFQGLTLTECEQVCAFNFIKNNELNPEEIIKQKKDIIRKSGLLDWIDVNADLDSVGGLNELKNWLNTRKRAFTQEAVETPQEQMVEESVEEDVSNDLKEFGVDSDAPDLFSSETENLSSDDLLSSSDEEDDDLEIPAFLRRQKN